MRRGAQERQRYTFAKRASGLFGVGWKGIIGASLLLGVTTLTFVLCLPVSSAPLRLNATTDFFAFQAKANSSVSFDVSEWEVIDFTPGSASSKPLTLRRQKEAQASERISLYIAAGDEVHFEKMPSTSEGAARFSLTFPKRAVSLSIALNKTLPHPLPREPYTELTTLDGKLGGSVSSSLLITLPSRASENKPSLRIGSFGFGKLMDDRSVHAGLRSGDLRFLDLPTTRLELWNAADLRFTVMDAELSAVDLSEQGIAVSIGGSVSRADVAIGSDGESEQLRSLMPSRFDRLKGTPQLALLATIIGVLGSAFGLLFSMAQVSERLGKRLREL